LTLSLTVPMIAILPNKVQAVPVTQDGTTTNNIQWYSTDSYDFYANLAPHVGKGFAVQPEFLMLQTQGTSVPVITTTTITVQGLDAQGQPISAQVIMYGTSAAPIATQSDFLFIDPDTGYPVAFSNITNIIQQGGTDGNKFLISTIPECEFLSSLPITPGTSFGASTYFQEYIGQYEPTGAQAGWQPGVYTWNGAPFTVPYYVTKGPGIYPGHQGTPFQPLTPEPITVYVNWHDLNHDLVPGDTAADTLPPFTVQTDSYGAAPSAGTIYVEGLNAAGQKLILSATFPVAGNLQYYTWDCLSEIDKVWGGSESDSYYLFTTPPASVPLFYYYISIDHMTIHAASYDILADGKSTTTITVALRDIDGNLVNWGGPFANATWPYIPLSFYTSGGTISPSYNVYITEETYYNYTTLTSDTNPRTIEVICDANVPIVDFSPSGGHYFHGDLNLMAWTQLTFDGVNIVPPTAAWPIYTLQWGYTDASGASHTMNAPAEPALPPGIAGAPAADGIKLDGPLYEVTINLYPGCNLISSPVYIMAPGSTTTFGGIPMASLFGTTEAKDAIEAVWWYNNVTGKWADFIPSAPVGTPSFEDGVGYWIKAEKPCVIELSGVAMENAPFAPGEYLVSQSWNLVGFTSIYPMNTVDYLESLATGNTAGTLGANLASAVGPIWTYNAQFRIWTRDPGMLWPTNAFWMNSKLTATAYLSP